MSAKKIVDTFNEIDKEMVYIKGKLDSLNELVSPAHSGSSFETLQKLKEENKSIQKEMLEVMKQIAVHDLLEGKPPLALKVFLQNQSKSSPVQQASAPLQQSLLKIDPAPTEQAMEPEKPNAASGKKKKGKGDANVSNDAAPANVADKPVVPAEGTANDKKIEKSKDQVKPEESKKAPDPVDESITVARLDFRVGRIVEVDKHPDADSLYVEKIDLGEAQPRTIVSGLVKFVPIEEMRNRMVVVLCNLKPAKMRGVMSEGMVMCASTPEKVEVLVPPKGSEPGDRVSVEGYVGKPDDQLNPKKKIWETVAPDLSVNASKVAVYKGSQFVVVGKGPVVSPSLINCPVK